SLRVTRGTGVANAQVLLLHLGNAVGDQAETVSATVATPTVALRKGSAVTVSGSTVVGKRLTAHHGSWDANGVRYSFQWLRDGDVVDGATKQTYTLGSSDVGH
ncbi:hypothetical protein, partial [Mycobacteroides abscessus]|uniref:hypothetical protein n=1 Tax=Mycobacteroides abscessus TaxID=36809 RepID=UPI001A958933